MVYAMDKSLVECQQIQRKIFNRSFADGPFLGVVAEMAYRKRVEFALRFVPNSATVLDFGCGDGRVTKGMLAQAKKVIGIDISEQAVEVAKKFNNHADITYLHTTIEDFSSDLRFDAILMFEIIEHVFNPQLIFQKVNGLLKEKGVLMLSTPNFLRLTRRIKQLYGIRQIRMRMGKNPNKIGCDHVREYTYGEVKAMLQEAGFDILAYEGVILWTDTVGGDLLRSVYWVQKLNFFLGSLFPSISGHIFIAAQKIIQKDTPT